MLQRLSADNKLIQPFSPKNIRILFYRIPDRIRGNNFWDQLTTIIFRLSSEIAESLGASFFIIGTNSAVEQLFTVCVYTLYPRFFTQKTFGFPPVHRPRFLLLQNMIPPSVRLNILVRNDCKTQLIIFWLIFIRSDFTPPLNFFGLMKTETWRPQRDSNSRCRRERAMSWASRR